MTDRAFCESFTRGDFALHPGSIHAAAQASRSHLFLMRGQQLKELAAVLC